VDVYDGDELTLYVLCILRAGIPSRTMARKPSAVSGNGAFTSLKQSSSSSASRTSKLPSLCLSQRNRVWYVGGVQWTPRSPTQ
jgi:hypothetical protein